jgi:diguanylate cyclase (GGDEF)-like protein
MPLDWLDHRTLLACNVLVATLFAALLIGVRVTYPRMRGATEAAIAFLLCIPGGALMATQTGHTHRLLIVFADSSILLFYFFAYLAIVRFLAVPGFPRLSGLSAILPIASIAFFTFIHDSVVARMVSLGFSVVLLRLLTGIAILRYPVQRRLMRAFAAFMLLSALLGTRNTIKTALHASASQFYPQGHIAAVYLLFAIFGFSITGIFFLGIFGDELAEIVGRRAQIDPLTGVLNRQGINLRFTAELNRAARSHHPLSILLIDLDHFKAINDTHGHIAGDQALSQVTSAILAEIRAYDLLGRFGGDEFLVLLPDTDTAKAIEIATRVLNSPVTAHTPHPITLSIGAAQATPNDHLADLVERADTALYEAKRNGRNRVHASQPATEPGAPHLDSEMWVSNPATQQK